MGEHDRIAGTEAAIIPAAREAGAQEPATGNIPSGLLQKKIARRALQRRAARASGGAGADDVHEAAAQGVTGSGGALPHSDTIQAAFGHHDVSGVQAHVGGAAAEASERIGAEAYATGNQVAFAKAPDLHTAAHEAAHVVQQRAGVQLKGGVGEAGDAYERHADAVADAVAGGQSAQSLLDEMAGGQPHRAGGTGLQRLTLQRRDADGGAQSAAHGIDREPTGQTGTTATAPSLSLGTQVGAQGQTTGAPANSSAAASHTNLHIDVLAGPNAKVRMPPGQAPTEAQLFTRRADHSGTHITTQRGTVDAPSVDNTMMPDSLYIGGQPDTADVRQGGLGDCYFMSVLLGIVNGDPGRIKSMMRYSGGNVSTTFHKLNTTNNQWEPITITDNDHLQTRRTPTGAVRLAGARMRIADQPTSTDWYAHVTGHTLEVKREDTFEVGLWGPLMEKTYADFTQQYGQYGRGRATGQAASGYDTINGGGGAQDCYNMFYGNAVANTGTQGINAAPGTDLVATNIPAVQRLVDFVRNKPRNPAGGSQRFLQARVSPVGAAQRCAALVTAVQTQITTDINAPGMIGPPTVEQQAEQTRLAQERTQLQNALPALATALQTYTSNSTATNAQALAVAARPIQQPGGQPLLWEPNVAAVYRELRESLGIVINLGTDNGPGRRNIYAAHSYNVNTVRLRDHNGLPLDITSAQVPARAGDIDVSRSQVVMENPHAGNEPDETGTGPADGVNDGRFTMTLDQFFRSYDLLRLAEVTQPALPPENPVGDFPNVTPSGPGTAYA